MCQVLWINIRGYISFSPRYQKASEISDARSDFHDAVAYIGLDRLRHPAVEPWSRGQSIECLRSGALIDVTGETSLQYDIKSRHRIFGAYFFPLLVCATVITDGCFVNSCVPLGKLDGDFRLNAEAVAANWDALDERGPKSLITRLHVGQIPICEHVTKSR